MKIAIVAGGPRRSLRALDPRGQRLEVIADSFVGLYAIVVVELVVD